jgi:hypothetical protein
VEKFSLYFLADLPLTFATQMLFRSVLRAEDTPPIVVIGLQAIFMTSHKEQYSLSRMLKGTQMLFRRSGPELFDTFTNIILLRIFPL